MAVTLSELAQLVHGSVIGDGRLEIQGAATLDAAVAGEVTLIDHADKLPVLEASPAAAAVIPRGVELNANSAGIQVDDVHAAFAQIVVHFRPQLTRRRGGIDPRASVSPTATVAADVEIRAGAFVDDEVVLEAGVTVHSGVQILQGARIGKSVTLYPNCVLYENTVVGARSIIHAGVVLGAHGFGYTAEDGSHQSTAQLGWVEVGEDVEIGASTCIDRGTYGPTRIGDGTKIDNLVQIGHNCQIGRHNLLCSQVGIAGSTSTGDYVVMAGQVGVRDHVHIGERAVLGAKAGVPNDIPPDVQFLGIPATPIRQQKVIQAAIHKLPELRKQIKRLQATVDRLTEQESSSAVPPPHSMTRRKRVNR